MLTSSELYSSYTNNPCSDDGTGAGTPYDLYKLSTFLKQVKYPCLKNVPGYSGIRFDNTDWKNNIALPYKYLEVLDPQLFSEIQPTITAGTSHAIRNAADISRACDIVTSSSSNGVYDSITQSAAATGWITRGATEHMFSFGENYITNCLFALGPDLVSFGVATTGRGTGCDEMDCLPPWKGGTQGSALGAQFSCESPSPESTTKECTPCGKCPEDDDTHPCCDVDSCVKKMNNCCGDPPGDSEEFIFDASEFELGFKYDQFQTVPPSGRIPADSSNSIRHIGYLLRKKYGGYANMQDVSENLWTCPRDLFIKYAQKNNGYDYSLNISKPGNYNIQRVKTISYVNETEDVKALLFNGYGVVLNTNIGFSKIRDNRGLAYPDKIWYHSYAIVGYDDTKTEFNECVFVLANSWGNWNSGGHPSWGKLPVGCFLVTESHLKRMLNLERIDKVGCRKLVDINGETIEEACTEDNSCVPWECGKNQRPMGMAFVLCFSDNLQQRKFAYKKFILNKNNTNQIKEKLFINQKTVPTGYIFNGVQVFSTDNAPEITTINTLDRWTSYLTETPNKNTMDNLQNTNGINFQTNSVNSGNNSLYEIASYKNIFNSTETVGNLFNHVTLLPTSGNIYELVGDKDYIFNTVDTAMISGAGGESPSKSLKFNLMTVSSIDLTGRILEALSNEVKNPELITEVLTLTNCEINISIRVATGGIIKGTNSKIGDKPLYGNIIFDNVTSGCMLPTSRIFGNAFFINTSVNAGVIENDAVFEENTTNDGIVKGNAYFNNADNHGTIYGDAIFEGECTNDGLVFGTTQIIS